MLHKIVCMTIVFLSCDLVVHAQTFAANYEPACARTRRLAEYESLKYGMFISFGMNTFTGNDYDEGTAPSTTYSPSSLDVKQWIRVARDAGMKYAVLTAKHMSGHCLWDSNGYDYDIATSSNTTDVIAEFMTACKQYGIEPGLYYCMIDPHNEKKVDWTGPVSSEYYTLIKHHLTELHTRYPGIRQQWLDIVIGKLNTAQRQELYNLIKKLSPDCLILANQSFRDGSYVDPNVWPTDIINGERTYPQISGHNPLIAFKGKTYYLPMETCDTISQFWFGMSGDPPKSVRTLYRMYTDAVSRNATLLLNVPPDKTGRIPQYHVERLLELKKVIDDPSLLPAPPLNYNCSIKASNTFKSRPEYSPQFAVDDDPTTRWIADVGVKTAWLELDLGKEVRFNVIKLKEPFAGRIKSFKVCVKDSSNWIQVASGTVIGRELVLKIKTVSARLVRLEIEDAVPSTLTKQNVIVLPGQEGAPEGPSISEFDIYCDNMK
jgi:alpha-L-fucosidase